MDTSLCVNLTNQRSECICFWPVVFSLGILFLAHYFSDICPFSEILLTVMDDTNEAPSSKDQKVCLCAMLLNAKVIFFHYYDYYYNTVTIALSLLQKKQ